MRRIIKIVTAVLTLCLTLFITNATALAVQTQPVLANSEVLIEQGYTENGVYYEVYEVTPTLSSKQSDITPNAVISMVVSRRVIYYAIVPLSSIPDPIYWTESLDQYTTLSGYLYYTSIFWDHDAGTTDVWYRGTLTGRM